MICHLSSNKLGPKLSRFKRDTLIKNNYESKTHIYIYIYIYIWVQPVGSFYWVIFYIFTQILGHFNAGLFFFYLTAGLSLRWIFSTTRLLWAVSTGFLDPQERAVLSAAAADLVQSFREIKVCIHFISFIKSLMWCKLYYFTQRNIRTRCQRRSSFSDEKAFALHNINGFYSL